MANFFPVYVGKYPTPSIPKKDVLKLNKLNLNAYVFAVGDGYSLRVNSFLSEEKAQTLVNTLKGLGFDAFYDHNSR